MGLDQNHIQWRISVTDLRGFVRNCMNNVFEERTPKYNINYLNVHTF
jgi:hypothetical protein